MVVSSSWSKTLLVGIKGVVAFLALRHSLR